MQHYDKLETGVGEAGKTYSCSSHCLGNGRGPDLRSRDITRCFLVALDDRDYFLSDKDRRGNR